MAATFIPGQVTIGKIVQHQDDLNAGAEDPEQLVHAAAKGMPGLPGAATSTGKGYSQKNSLASGASGGTFGGPSVPSYGSGGSALTSPNAHVTLQMLINLDDPSSGAVLGQAMMALLKDSIENRQDQKRQLLQAGLAKVGNALASAANEAQTSKDERSDLEQKSNIEMSSFVVGMVSAGVQALAAVTSGIAGTGAVSNAIHDAAGVVGSFNGAYDKLAKAQEDQVDLNSNTWNDKAVQAHIDVMKAINEGDMQSAQQGVEDATDSVKDCRQMVQQIIQAAKDTYEKTQFTK